MQRAEDIKAGVYAGQCQRDLTKHCICRGGGVFLVVGGVGDVGYY